MMRFANHENPVLLEALGNLLTKPFYSRDYNDAKQLSARAFLKASYVVPSEEQRAAYRELAKRALSMQTAGRLPSQLSLGDLEASFKQELASAESWYSGVRQDELAWIKEGQDPEKAYVAKYYQEPAIGFTFSEFIGSLTQTPLVLVCLVGLALALLVLWRGLRLRSGGFQPPQSGGG